MARDAAARRGDLPTVFLSLVEDRGGRRRSPTGCRGRLGRGAEAARSLVAEPDGRGGTRLSTAVRRAAAAAAAHRPTRRRTTGAPRRRRGRPARRRRPAARRRGRPGRAAVRAHGRRVARAARRADGAGPGCGSTPRSAPAASLRLAARAARRGRRLRPPGHVHGGPRRGAPRCAGARSWSAAGTASRPATLRRRDDGPLRRPYPARATTSRSARAPGLGRPRRARRPRRRHAAGRRPRRPLHGRNGAAALPLAGGPAVLATATGEPGDVRAVLDKAST